MWLFFKQILWYTHGQGKWSHNMRRIIFPQGERDKVNSKAEEGPRWPSSQSDSPHSCLPPSPQCFKLRLCGWNYLFFSHGKSGDWQLIEIRTLGRTSGFLSWLSGSAGGPLTAPALSGIFIAAFKFTRLSIKRGNGAPFTAARGDCPNIL